MTTITTTNIQNKNNKKRVHFRHTEHHAHMAGNHRVCERCWQSEHELGFHICDNRAACSGHGHTAWRCVTSHNTLGKSIYITPHHILFSSPQRHTHKHARLHALFLSRFLPVFVFSMFKNKSSVFVNNILKSLGAHTHEDEVSDGDHEHTKRGKYDAVFKMSAVMASKSN